MAPRDPSDPDDERSDADPEPERAPARRKPKPAKPAPGPTDGFELEPGKRPAFVLQPQRFESNPMPRSRVLDPRLMPHVPPTATSDPARQFHALLGLPRRPVPPPPAPVEAPRPPPKPEPPAEAPFGLEKILQTLPPARAAIIRQVLTGPSSRLKRALTAFVEDQKFQRMDFESKRRALAAFDLRY